MQNNRKYEQMADIIRAMAHPSRLLILDKLQEKDYCVCELQEFVGCDMSTVSRHLSVLRNAGIIVSRKLNNQVIYSLECPCVLEMYQCVIDVKNRVSERKES